MKIQTKLLLVFLLIGVLPIAVTAVIFYYEARRAIDIEFLAHLESVASLQEERVDAYFRQNDERLRLISSRTQLRRSLREQLERPAEEHLTRMRNIIEDARVSIEELEAVMILSKSGTVIVSTEAGEEGSSMVPAVRLPEDVGNESKVHFVRSGDGSESSIIVVGPLRLDGVTLGVLALRVDPRGFEQLVTSYGGLGESGETLLGKRVGPDTAVLIAPPRFDAHAALKRTYSLKKPTPMKFALDGERRAIDSARDYRNIDVMAVTRYLSAVEIGMVVKIDRHEVELGTAGLLDTVWIIVGIILATLLALALILSRTLTRPIHALSEATERLGEGGLYGQAEVRSRDEIGKLAETFNRMSNRLREAHEGLEQQIDERTRELKISEERFALAVRGSTDGIWDWHIPSKSVYFSDRFKELLGYAPGEFTDNIEAWQSRLHPDDREAALGSLRDHLSEGTPHDIEYRLKRSDGSYRWFRARGMAVRDELGTAVRVAGSINDIHERKEAEAELLRSNRELEQFAYVASHDLKEPLRMVASYVQILQRRYQGKLDEDADEFIGYAMDGAERMRGLIEDLLLYSRVGTRGKNPVPVRLDGPLRVALKNLKVAIEDAGAVIEAEDGTLPEVLADENQLVQLFQNLIGNGIKFRREGNAPRIRISSKAAGAMAEIRIADNGIGIAEEHRERIFHIFQRLHARDQYDGTGIGLAVCKKIVERHGGTIRVESDAGAGATLVFTLPLADVPS